MQRLIFERRPKINILIRLLKNLNIIINIFTVKNELEYFKYKTFAKIRNNFSAAAKT